MNNVDLKENLIRHYKKDAAIYDFNRRFFLFGRDQLVREIDRYTKPNTILEIGCGTGSNLFKLCQIFPDAKITGLDLSEDMLRVAQSKLLKQPNVTLQHDTFDENTVLPTVDLIVCSYITSTVPDIERFLSLVQQHLNPKGYLACVDFYRSNFKVFDQWISHSIPIRTHFPDQALIERFQKNRFVVKRAYGGIWKYFYSIGQKR